MDSFAEKNFLRAFADAMENDDLVRFMAAVDTDCVWTLPATGENFIGIENVRKLMEHAMASRTHTKERRIKVDNIFSTEDSVCLEYTHRSIAARELTAKTLSPPVEEGKELRVQICLVMHLKNGKFDRVNEYSDFGTLLGKKLFPSS